MRVRGLRLACLRLGLLGVTMAFPFANLRAQDPPSSMAPAPCEKAQFETAVTETANALGVLTAKNKPEFQGKLRQLKDKRGWTHDRFMTEATPLVQDEQIASYDRKSDDLLTTIMSMGEAGSEAATPDCALLAKLRSHMAMLVEIQTTKWSYMFEKIDKELAK